MTSISSPMSSSSSSSSSSGASSGGGASGAEYRTSCLPSSKIASTTSGGSLGSSSSDSCGSAEVTSIHATPSMPVSTLTNHTASMPNGSAVASRAARCGSTCSITGGNQGA